MEKIPGGAPRIVARVVHRSDGAARATGPEAFDPADHNIVVVLRHVEANPDQLGSVLGLERDGKNRSTLIEWLEGQSESDDS